MKKLTFLIIAILFSSAASAQTMFSVPELTDLQKLQMAKGLCYNNILCGINFGKSQGKTVEEYAKYCGDQFKTSWNKEMGFEEFVNAHLYSFVAMAGNVVILSQSDNKIAFRISQVYTALENQGPFWNVSFAEMMKYYKYAVPTRLYKKMLFFSLPGGDDRLLAVRGGPAPMKNTFHLLAAVHRT